MVAQHVDIVVACVEGEHSVKLLEKRLESVVSVVENAAYAPIIVWNAKNLGRSGCGLVWQRTPPMSFRYWLFSIYGVKRPFMPL